MQFDKASLSNHWMDPMMFLVVKFQYFANQFEKTWKDVFFSVKCEQLGTIW